MQMKSYCMKVAVIARVVSFQLTATVNVLWGGGVLKSHSRWDDVFF